MNLIATARLTGHSSQRVFDLLLQTLAEPGRTLQLPVSTVHPEIPMSTWLALALADVDVAVSIEDDPVHPTAGLVADASSPLDQRQSRVYHPYSGGLRLWDGQRLQAPEQGSPLVGSLCQTVDMAWLIHPARVSDALRQTLAVRRQDDAGRRDL